MATSVEYALMAGLAYQVTRDPINQFPVPIGWIEMAHVPGNPGFPQYVGKDGFEAVSFMRETAGENPEIVISFAGTGNIDDWIHGNIPLKMGNFSEQLAQAARYYLDIRTANASANITFTGHSLGGGLASLVAVMFGESAFTFDQAPFHKSAETFITTDSNGHGIDRSAAIDLRNYLSGNFPVAMLSRLDAFISANSNFNPNPNPSDTLAARAGFVTDINVQSEVVSNLFASGRIGTQTNIPNASTGVSAFTLHSMALLTAFLQSNQTADPFAGLNDVTSKLPDLLKMIFDPTLFAFATGKNNDKNVNFLERIVNHEAGRDPISDTDIAPDGMVTRFTADLWKLAQDDGLTMSDGLPSADPHNLSKALIAFAMEKYYTETDESIGHGEALFADVSDGSGGIYFDTKEVASSLKDAKGYKFFKAYLSELSFRIPAERLIGTVAATKRDWYVQAGSTAMNATDTKNRGAFMLGFNGADTLVGETGNDLLVGNKGADTLRGGAGNDILIGGKGDDTLEGGEGEDTYEIDTGDGNDTIIDAGHSILRRDGKILRGVFQQGLDGDYHLLGNSDEKIAIHSPAKLDFGNGDSITFQNLTTAELVDQNLVDVRLIDALSAPQNPVDTFFGDKQDWDSDPGSNGIQIALDEFGNVVRADGQSGRPDAGEGGREDVFYGSSADEVEKFLLGNGNDFVYADGAESLTSSAGGRDFIEAGVGSDTVLAGGGDDWVEGGSEDDLLVGGAGDDVIYADASNNQTFSIDQAIAAGETGQSTPGQGDLISGDAGDDIVFGAATNDLLAGGDGEDVIIGGAGDDTIYGDKSITQASHGWSLVRSVSTTADGNIFNAAFTSATVSGDEATGGLDVIYGGAGDDWIFAGAGDDTVDGGSGDDIIQGEGGSDALVGGDGNDRLDGDSGVSVAAGLAGDDYLDGGAGDDVLIGEAGDDILYGGAGDDVISGGDGNDILYGGPGIDVLAGGSGKDTYVFNKGDGTEYIVDTPSGADDPEASVLILGPGINRSDIKFTLGSLEVDLGDGDAIHFVDFNADDPSSTPVLDSIQFADGTAMSYQDVLDQGFDIDGTDGDDVIAGTAVTDRIDAKAGNDAVTGKTGDDVIHGGDGNDSLLGGAGDDALYGDAGDDQLNGDVGDDVLVAGAGNDEITGGNGNDQIDGGAGNDDISGNSGDDVIAGGTGDDVLRGYDGADTYLFASGDGLDTIEESGLIAIGITDAGSVDVIRFAQGVSQSDVTLQHRANGDLIVQYGQGDQILVSGQYLSVGNDIERIEFADGSVITATQIAAVPPAPILGTLGNDLLVGTTGTDTLLGFAGDDVLKGGAGNDRLEGGAGADTYDLNVDMGRDTLVDSSPTAQEVGTLKLATGYGLINVKAQRTGNDLFVGMRGTANGALIKDYFVATAPAQHWQIESPDGSLTAVEDLISQPDPFAGNVPLSEMNDYKQSVVGSWAAFSHETPLPTYANVFRSRKDLTQQYRPDPNKPAQIIVFDPIISTSVQGYGVQKGNTIVAAYPDAFTVQTQILNRQSDASAITAIGTPTTTTSQQLHPFKLLGTPHSNGHITTSSFDIGAATSETSVVSTNQGWVPIALDPTGPSDGTFGFNRTTEKRVIEEINAGNSDNVIQGVLDNPQGVLASYGQHVALIDAGGGNDVVNAGAMDFVYGNDGNDQLFGGYLVYGGNGNDLLSGGTNLYGGAGDDTLQGGAFMDGGAGDDALSGQAGATTFYIDPTEAGQDRIGDTAGISRQAFEGWYYSQIGIPTPDENRAFAGMWGVIGDTGFELNHFYNRPNQYDHLLGQKDRYYRDGNGYPSDGQSTVYSSLDDLRNEFDRFDIQYVAADIHYIQPLPAVPQVFANDYAALQPLYDAGLIEQDVVEFGAGVGLSNLTVLREQVADGVGVKDSALVLSWSGGHAMRVALAQPDDLIGTGIERYRFADGTSILTKDMLARATPVVLHQDAEDFTFLPGSGIQTLDSSYTHIFFDATIVAEDISISRSDADLIISRIGSDDRLTISNWYADPNAIPSVSAQFYNGGLILNADDLTSAGLVVRGTAADETLYGLDGFPNTLYGEGGSDVLIGGGGNDILNGGSGDDLLAGGSGNDTYVYNLGDGNDVISDSDATPGNSDTLALGPGIVANDVRVTADETNLYLTFQSTGQQITLSNWEQDPASRIERVAFADGSIWSAEDLDTRSQMGVSYVGSDDAESVVGTPFDDHFDMQGGDDQVDAGAGNDVIDGGPGNDFLNGGNGDDTYGYKSGYGIDAVDDSGGNDVLQFGEGIQTSDVLVTRDPYGTLYLEAGSPANRVELYNWFTAENQIEHVTFSNGTVWDAIVLESLVTIAPATGFGDILNLSDDADVLNGLGGDDQIYGNGGNDILSGGAGSDYIEGGAGSNLVMGGAGDDFAYASTVGSKVFFLGGEGVDGFQTNVSGNIVAFNMGDGEDSLTTNPGDAFTLSLGGISASTITLSTDGTFIRIGFSSTDGVSSYAYGLGPESWPQGTLQIIGTDIRNYDLNAVVQAFIDARAQDNTITQWSAADALTANVVSISSTQAIGGAIAYQYAMTGGVDGLTISQQQTVLSATEFGIAPQAITVEVPNRAPVVSAADTTLALNAEVDASTLFSVSDLDGDVSTQYEFWDSTSRDGSAHFEVDGVAQAANQSIAVADLAGVVLVGGSLTGSDQLYVRAYDGELWSDWKSFTATTGTPVAPDVSVADTRLVLNQSVSAASLFEVSDANGDAVTAYEFWDSTDRAGSAHFEIDAVAQSANQSILVNAADLGAVTLAGGSSTGTDQLYIRAYDGQLWGDWKSFIATTGNPIAPTVLVADQTLALDQTVAASALFAASDENGDAITKYEFWDSTDRQGSASFDIDGILQPGNPVAVDTADLTRVTVHSGTVSGNDQLWVRAYDGQLWSDWQSFVLTSGLPEGPVVTVSDQSIAVGQNMAATDFFSVSDANGDVPTRYEFWDSTARTGSAHFEIGGIVQGANQSITVNAADLGAATLTGGSSTGTDQIFVRAYDGQLWSAWQSFTLTTGAPVAPQVSVSDQTFDLNQAVDASTLFSVFDQNGDAMTQYEFWDGTAANGSAHFEIGGAVQSANQSISVSAEDLATVSFVAGSSTGTDQLYVRAFDGQLWSEWKSFTVTSGAPRAPGVTANDSNIDVSESMAVTDFFSVSDANGDAMVRYEFWDSTARTGSARFEIDGVAQAANQSIAVQASDLGDARIVGGSLTGTDQLWVRAYDGQIWSDWRSFILTTGSPVAPAVLAPNQQIALNEVVAASDLFSADDANGDAITQYEFWDSTSGGAAFAIDGVAQGENQSISVSAAQISDVTMQAGAQPGTDQFYVRAYDGQLWSTWGSFNLGSFQMFGTNGDDVLIGGSRGDALQGLDGDDQLSDSAGNNLLDGGNGNDTLTGTGVLIGGQGNDLLALVADANVVGLNAGDGQDSLASGSSAGNTLSLGGGIQYADLALTKSGDDLVLKTGSTDQITLKDWYAGTTNKSVVNMQVIAEAMSGYNPGGSDTLLDNKVENFDFAALANAFDTAGQVSGWALTNALLSAHLSGSDTAAIGGDLAYQYGKSGPLTGIGLAPAQDVINAAGFGSSAQTLRTLPELQQGQIRLS